MDTGTQPAVPSQEDNAPDRTSGAGSEKHKYILTIPAAGRKFFGIGKSASYEAARRGQIPTIRIGRRLFVPLAAVENMLADTANKAAERVETRGEMKD